MHVTPGSVQQEVGQGPGNRGSAATQSLVSVALLLPTLLLWYLRTLSTAWDWDSTPAILYSLVVTLALNAYFVAVVAVFARDAARRVPAVITAGTAAVVDVGGSVALAFADYSDPIRWIDRIVTVVTLTLYVCAWGIARRRRRAWVFGLIPTFVVAVLLVVLYNSSVLYETFGFNWFVYWAVQAGTLVLCCAFCWGFDQIGSSAPVSHPTAGGAAVAVPASVPAYPVAGGTAPVSPQQMYGAAPQTNAMAIAALVAALVFAPLGVVFGHLALSQLKRTGEDGRGLALAGLVIGYVGTVLLVLSILIVVVYFAVLAAVMDSSYAGAAVALWSWRI